MTTGGASVGEHDLVRDVLSEDGLAIDFWQIAMRPGKPLMFGHYRGTPMLGLPGNPVSTLVCSLLFLKPALDQLSGLPEGAEAAADRAARRRRSSRTTAARIICAPGSSRAADGALEAVPFEVQDSSMMRPLARRPIAWSCGRRTPLPCRPAARCRSSRSPAAPAAVAHGSILPGLSRPRGSSAALMRRIRSSSAPPRQSGIM